MEVPLLLCRYQSLDECCINWVDATRCSAAHVDLNMLKAEGFAPPLACKFAYVDCGYD